MGDYFGCSGVADLLGVTELGVRAGLCLPTFTRDRTLMI